MEKAIKSEKSQKYRKQSKNHGVSPKKREMSMLHLTSAYLNDQENLMQWLCQFRYSHAQLL